MQQIDPARLFRKLSFEVRNAQGEPVERVRLGASTVGSTDEWVWIDKRIQDFLVPIQFEGSSTIRAPGYEPRTQKGWPEGTVVLEARE